MIHTSDESAFGSDLDFLFFFKHISICLERKLS